MGAVIILASRIAEVLEIKINDAIFWSDSMNILWWIRGIIMSNANFNAFSDVRDVYVILTLLLVVKMY